MAQQCLLNSDAVPQVGEVEGMLPGATARTDGVRR